MTTSYTQNRPISFFGYNKPQPKYHLFSIYCLTKTMRGNYYIYYNMTKTLQLKKWNYFNKNYMEYK